jgi:hypothetical protein
VEERSKYHNSRREGGGKTKEYEVQWTECSPCSCPAAGAGGKKRHDEVLAGASPSPAQPNHQLREPGRGPWGVQGHAARISFDLSPRFGGSPHHTTDGDRAVAESCLARQPYGPRASRACDRVAPVPPGSRGLVVRDDAVATVSPRHEKETERQELVRERSNSKVWGSTLLVRDEMIWSKILSTVPYPLMSIGYK